MRAFFVLMAMMTLPVLGFSQHNPGGLGINEKAPGFSALDQFGNRILLQDQLKQGPVVLVFYRGQWCPYCNRQLKGLEDSLTLITSKGARVIAITPEKPESIAQTVKKTKATYSVLHDEQLTIMKSYKVDFLLDSATLKRYKGFGIDVIKTNGANGASLPVPAVYIINREGRIVYRHFNPDYKKRPSVKEIVSHLSR